MIHQVRALPKEGEYVRTKCGRMTNDRMAVAVHKHDAPEGAEFCRGACWRQGLSYKSKVVLMEDLARAYKDEPVPAAEIKAILEDRYYPEVDGLSPAQTSTSRRARLSDVDNNRSPKAA